MKLKIYIPLIALILIIFSCEEQENNVNNNQNSKRIALQQPIQADGILATGYNLRVQPTTGEQVPIYSEALAELSNQLLLTRPNIKLTKAEFMSDRIDGLTIFADDRILDLSSRWVPNDARRGGDDDINYLVYQPLAIANGLLDSEGPIDQSFDTWNNVDCNNVALVKNDDTGIFPSAILTLGGVPGDPSVSDINTVGFLPGEIFDAVLGPGASTSVLGVTFTFVFINPDGTPTDVDENGKNDTAIKEIWYNDSFLWNIGGANGVDIESVALHENGHALEKAHIGIGFFDPRTEVVGFNPRAVMNAAYIGPFPDAAPLDNKSHCLVFGTWPIK